MNRSWLAPALAVALVWVAAPEASAGPPGLAGVPVSSGTLYEDSFAGTDTPAGSWTTVSTAGGGGPCLTAASGNPAGGIPVCPGGPADQPGSGMLQLTDNGTDESGYVISNNPIIARDGAHISFDMAQYDARQFSGRGGDGISFFLVDGSIPRPAAGRIGGALGYNGLQGAILGLGFDEFGNFSTTEYGGANGPGLRPESIVVRGAAATKYRYLTGVRSPQPLAVDTAKMRAQAARHVSIDITGNVLNVTVGYGKGTRPVRVIGPLNLSSIPGQPPLPPTFKYGFAGSTGSATAYHGITDLIVSGLPPKLALKVTHQGTFTAGGTGSYQMAVADDQAAGPTISPVSVSLPVPAGYTVSSAGGNGWQCQTASAVVTCTRPDALQPGMAYPPVSVRVGIPAGSAGSVTVTGTAKTTPGPASGVTSTDTAPVAGAQQPPAAGPALAMTVTPRGDFTAGGTGGYQLTVSNAPAAGPTSGKVTATFQVPAGQKVSGATGPGWTCATSGQTVTCTRPGSGPDALGGGASYPPVTISTTIPASASGPAVATATANTPGNTDPDGAQGKVTVTVAPAPVVAPSLAMTVTPQGPFTAGNTGTYQLTVSNAAAAGPTTGTVTETFAVPAGQTVTSAAGQGWICGTSGQTVTCTRPGTGPDALAGGSSYPPVLITARIAPSASGQVNVTGTANTPGNADPNGAQGAATVAIGQIPPAPPAPELGMTVTPQGDFAAGGTGGYQLTVSNAPPAGPTTGTVSATLSVPEGQTVTSAAGPGWTCATLGQAVTCTRPGSGDDALQPGTSYPPVTVAAAIPASAQGPAVAAGTANTPGDADPDGARGKTTVTVTPAPVVAPSLAMTVTPQGPFTAGGTGSYQLTVSDAPAAGPTTGQVTATFPAPAGHTVTSASGLGWTCGTAGQTVTCTRPGTGLDALAGGASYPPVTITTAIPASASGTLDVTATAGTPGNADPRGAQGKASVRIVPRDVAPASAPALSLTVTPQGDFTAGGSGSYQLVVSDAPTAGPTTGTVTETFTVPDGQKITSADGPGWSCTTSGQKVTCTRPGSGDDVLTPGSSYPPVTIGTSIASSAGGPAEATVGVNTPGNADPAGAQGTATVIIAPAPSAGSIVCRGGNIETTIGPGITFQTKTSALTGEGDLGQCMSPTDPSVTGGTFTFQATGQGECPNGITAHATGTIIWNNGQTSTVEASGRVDQNQIGMTNIRVKAGEFAGDTGAFAGPVTYLPWYQCLFPTGVGNGRGIINEGFLNP